VKRRLAALTCLVLLAACVPAPVPPPDSPSPLAIEVLYPYTETELEMGQALHTIARVLADDGTTVRDASLTVTVVDPDGAAVAEVEAVGDDQGTYRSQAWTVPHRSRPGEWSLQFAASSLEAQGTATATYRVRPSTSEELLTRYGFWIDAPTLRGIDPVLAGEFGDAHNGRILWGGTLLAAHVLPAAWVEIQWRQGPRPLEDERDVLRFFREDLGRFGFTAIRALGPITPTTFKNWKAWHVEGRGEFRQDQVEWIVFYAPEVNRTYAIGTTVVLPPAGIDAPAALRESFAVYPEVLANGVAPAPLPELLPAPELISPALGSEFRGEVPVVLSWDWLRPLEDDEAFQVRLDYNYVEANPEHRFTTRQTSLTLPPSLYRTPNCQVFNWQVSVIRTGSDDPRGGPVSYDSLYSYVLWSYPSEAGRPFPLMCPNAQY
jgi:hypothetical protein